MKVVSVHRHSDAGEPFHEFGRGHGGEVADLLAAMIGFVVHSALDVLWHIPGRSVVAGHPRAY